MAVVTIDSYSESNRSADFTFGAATSQELYLAQSFTCSDGIILDSCKFYLKRSDIVDGGTLYAKVYNLTGTYGTNSYPSGNALATSGSVAVSSIGTSYSLVTFSFSGAGRISLSTSGTYAIALYYASYDTNNDDMVQAGYDYTSSSHGGNLSYYRSGSWATSANDFIFYVYGDTVAPTVTTQACSSVTHNTATANGNVTATGGAAVSRRGFCYKTGTSGDPTTSDTTAYDDGTFGTGSYTKGLTGLSASTGYRVRAYAINAVGTSYGSTVQLTTSSADGPVVSTTTTSRLDRKCVIFGGNVTDEGTETVTERGIYYGTDEFSQTNKLTSASGAGAYSIFLSGLTPNTKYYYKAFATSSIGTSYGDILNFTTGSDKPEEDSIHYLPPLNLT